MKRRIAAVCALRAFAGAAGGVRTSGEYYYRDDHYNSFRRILE
jgi:guanyl-specific ribonuclease Sa